MANEKPIIKLENLTYFYPNSKTPAIENINLAIYEREFVTITGPSGGGKSTLCRIFNGIIPHFYGGKLEGRAIVNGIDVKSSSVSELSRVVGLVFQNPVNQIVNLTVEEEIAFGLENLMFPSHVIEERISWVLEILNIKHLRNRLTYTLSGGELQKVALASILALKPKVLVLDEVTANMDPYSAREFLKLLRDIWHEIEITIILVEHRLSEVLQYANRLILLNKIIIADGLPREILKSDLLEKMGIEVPPVTLFSKKLGVKPLPLNVKEAIRVFREWLPRK
ncbi:MAG: ABC transporter ATP-binding protein [Thermoprotei archaeon]|nr:MAG: ABC transporter ATP-binding protein [Thermoprotei archaeon]